MYFTNKEPSKRVSRALALTVCAGLGYGAVAGPAHAELVLSFYSGANFSPDSDVDFDFNDGAGRQSVNTSWDGEALVMPPYFGVRATWWFDDKPNWGVSIDNAHTKVAADPMPAQFNTLEFTDGINMVTANVQYRFLNDTKFTPYLGVGVGFTTPHVEVVSASGATRTSEYQFGGPAAQALIGVEAEINDRWAVFGELKSGYADISADLNGGGWLKTEVISNQVAFGVSYTVPKR
ncbi:MULTISPECIES: outer membrane beta-barrel protein [Sediminimonas]|uniref:outer membrane beta-barrel protein n=1 Tax=Sediminimonas TaxID=659427 RepID=UPI000408F156|nr:MULTISPECIES: OmpW family outer membrane protein [Sediminimonas]MDR9484021.1 OmpW family outer membrane protein [Sediminimonas sp.]